MFDCWETKTPNNKSIINRWIEIILFVTKNMCQFGSFCNSHVQCSYRQFKPELQLHLTLSDKLFKMTFSNRYFLFQMIHAYCMLHTLYNCTLYTRSNVQWATVTPLPISNIEYFHMKCVVFSMPSFISFNFFFSYIQFNSCRWIAINWKSVIWTSRAHCSFANYFFFFIFFFEKC